MLGVIKFNYMLNQRILKLNLTDVNLNLEKLTDSCGIINYHHGKNLWLQTAFKHGYSTLSFLYCYSEVIYLTLYLQLWYSLILKC